VGVLLLALAGCSGEEDENEPRAEHAPHVVQPGAPGEPSHTLSEDDLAELEPPAHTDADVRFVQGMIPHHQQALVMAALAPRNGAGRDVRLVARRIALSQEAEIELMKVWLTERGESASAGHHQGMLMPGMLTEAKLARLEAARNGAFDRLFLRSMIRHHHGALTMVRQLYAAGGGQEPAVDFLARNVDSDQQIEIERMQGLLAQLEAS
jgi:uncharacterized protein (DUF305 family)